MALKLETSNADAKRILKDGQLVAFALALANGRWGLYDRDDKKLTVETFATPKAALKAYEGIALTTQGRD
jgi:hypothetical protein